MSKKIILAMLVVIALVTVKSMLNLADEQTKLDESIYNLVDYYQETYVGDNSSIGGILHELPLGNSIESFSLGTAERPYSITVNYSESKVIKRLSGDDLKKVLEYNSTALFALVKNVDMLEFNINGNMPFRCVKTREEIQLTYAEPLSKYVINSDIWKSEVLKKEEHVAALIELMYEIK